jgi:transposase
MAKRSGAVHVATTSRTYKGRKYTTYLLRRTYREGDQVKHETLGNLSHLPEEIIESIREQLRGVRYVAVDKAFEILRSLPHGHVAAVLGTLRKIGLDRLISSQPGRERALVEAMIAARIISPTSKLATARELSRETVSSSLGLVLDLQAVNEDELYGAMDWLLERQEKIEKSLAERHLTEGSLVLYDVTSSYFEGRHCPLGAYGHSRDGQRGKLQIVYGLLCNDLGCPVSVEVFEGNMSDSKTLSSQVAKVRHRFGLKRVVLVGDRGMITEARIREDLQGLEGVDWITAMRAPAIQKLMESGKLQMSLFDKKDLAEISHPDYPDERLIVCRNPLLAEDRKRKREELMQATEALLEKVAQATRRTKWRLKGKDAIGLRVGRVINKYKVAKLFDCKIEDDGFSYCRNPKKIAREADLDGIYVIRTSMPKKEAGPTEVVAAYKNLSVVERAFRCLKTVDLKVRPIHHRLADRVRAHILLCMLAYHVEWHMRQALGSLLFDDEEKEIAESLRTSPVAPAKRSDSAMEKVNSRKNSEGLPVHSFRTFIKDLATLARNLVRTPGTSESSFYMNTIPTPLQQKAFELLGCSSNL